MTTTEVSKWNANDWRRNLKYASPSSGGAVGVMFCWCRNPGSGGANYGKCGTADFVLKPIAGSPAPAKFAERFLGKAVGAQGVHTKAVLKGSIGYNTVLDMLNRFKGQLDNSVQTERARAYQYTGKMKRVMREETARTNNSPQPSGPVPTVPGEDLLNRWNSIWCHYAAAGAFLIQETAPGFSEFGDVYRETNGLEKLLKDKPLMTNLGQLFAADALIGNGDRLFSPNMGNVLFNGKGVLFSIDSATVLTNYKTMLDATTEMGPFIGVDNKEVWADKIITGENSGAAPTKTQLDAFNQGKVPVLPPSFGMTALFEVDKWWIQTFRKHLEASLVSENQRRTVPLASPDKTVWDGALNYFKTGVNEGMKKIDSLLSGFNWLGVKSTYKKYEKNFGWDPNLDWTNLKIRRLYFKSRKRGDDDKKAMELVNAYVKKKFPNS